MFFRFKVEIILKARGAAKRETVFARLCLRWLELKRNARRNYVYGTCANDAAVGATNGAAKGPCSRHTRVRRRAHDESKC